MSMSEPDASTGAPRSIALKLPYRPPIDAGALFAFFGERAVPGIEAIEGDTYRRTLRLPHGAGIVELEAADGHIGCSLQLEDIRDLPAAVDLCRRLLDLDADPVAIASVLAADPLLRPLVTRSPGVRVPGSVDGTELAMRAVIGQQISIKGARTIAARLVTSFGEPLTAPAHGLTHLFPGADELADADLTKLGVPGARQATLRSLASALAAGEVTIDPGTDRDETRAKLLALPGIGPWTASYIAVRGLGDADGFMATDLGVRRALQRLGADGDPIALAERWRPWRAYAQQQLWTSLSVGVEPVSEPGPVAPAAGGAGVGGRRRRARRRPPRPGGSRSRSV